MKQRACKTSVGVRNFLQNPVLVSTGCKSKLRVQQNGVIMPVLWAPGNESVSLIVSKAITSELQVKCCPAVTYIPGQNWGGSSKIQAMLFSPSAFLNWTQKPYHRHQSANTSSQTLDQDTQPCRLPERGGGQVGLLSHITYL